MQIHNEGEVDDEDEDHTSPKAEAGGNVPFACMPSHLRLCSDGHLQGHVVEYVQLFLLG